MTLNDAAEHLGWPSSDEILDPKGAGPAVYADLAQAKLGIALGRRLTGGHQVRVGILCPDGSSDSSQAPVALVCEFDQPAPEIILREAHRLAWNFCRTSILITIEPHTLRVWDCSAQPAPPDDLGIDNPAEIRQAQIDLTAVDLSGPAAESLQWVNLVSGKFVRQYQPHGYFKRNERADSLLLQNLKDIRKRLCSPQSRLPIEICHDLLARLIFIQFLFQRQDAEGNTALNARKLAILASEGILSARYNSLEGILRNHHDTYELFGWLNNIFNGDLFPSTKRAPGKSLSALECERENVTQEHLDALADLVSGHAHTRTGQRYLWTQYAFDVIPLDFISSIYEEFVGEAQGTHYTPGHLVDFMLDGVLPWGGTEWNLRILDPACGSGIFLVKSYQRLIHRWKRAHPDRSLEPKDLRRLLENNLFGVDINHEAVRVAAFSLYLTMCDEIDPRHYWTQVKFPPLRGQRLIGSDFFSENAQGFRSVEDRETYDLVIGNAPWGKGSVTSLAKMWAENTWPLSYQDIGPAFIGKGIKLLKLGGVLSMLQPVNVLLLNRSGPTNELRQRLFSFKVTEIINLATLRFGLFQKAISPSCIITVENAPPDDSDIVYVCPKPTHSTEDEYCFVIEPQDIHQVKRARALDPMVWTGFMWGQERDLRLLERLRAHNTIGRLQADDLIDTREGIIRGKSKVKSRPDLLGLRLLSDADFPLDNPFTPILARQLAKNTNPNTHERDSTNMTAFKPPQLIIKQSWVVSTGRFHAAQVQSGLKAKGVLCSDSYVSVHAAAGQQMWLESIWLTFNSRVAIYFFLLTSGRFASYRPQLLEADIRTLPLPEPDPQLLTGLNSLRGIDERVRDRFALTEPEWVLIEDLCNIALCDFKGDADSPGRQSTIRRRVAGSIVEEEPEMRQYCEFFLRVLEAAFGEDTSMCMTVYQEAVNESSIPLRLIAFHLGWPGRPRISVDLITGETLRSHLHTLNILFTKQGHQRGNIYYQRVARVHRTIEVGSQRIPTIFNIKPDQVRYWTRSAAMHDADEVFADIQRFGFGQPADAASLMEH